MKTAEIKDIGPIERLTIPVPDDGGVIVFRGVNGCGKSMALDVIDAAISGGGSAPVRDNCTKGQFQGLGVTMTISKSTRRIGEAEVHSLTGKFDLASLVDPGIQQPEKADGHRIKALVQLTGHMADQTLFRPLVADVAEFDSIVSPAALTHSDLLAMASAIKRDFEAAARKSEAEATNARARADAAEKAAEGLDMSAECDRDLLQRRLEEAIAEKSKLAAEGVAADKAIRIGTLARKALEKAKQDYNGPTIADAQQMLDAARKNLDSARTAQEAARKALEEANRRLDAKAAQVRNAEVNLGRAEDYARLVNEWQQQIDAGSNVEAVPAHRMTEAVAAVEAAKRGVEQGALITRAKAQFEEGADYRKLADKHWARAEKLRQAAKGTDEVLTQLVAKSGVPLRVAPINLEMRLMLDTDRGPECFADLSDGERWRIAIDIAIQAIGRGGELTISQGAWESLDPHNRKAIAEQARAGGLIIYTAEASDGELRAEVFGGAAA